MRCIMLLLAAAQDSRHDPNAGEFILLWGVLPGCKYKLFGERTGLGARVVTSRSSKVVPNFMPIIVSRGSSSHNRPYTSTAGIRSRCSSMGIHLTNIYKSKREQWQQPVERGTRQAVHATPNAGVNIMGALVIAQT